MYWRRSIRNYNQRPQVDGRIAEFRANFYNRLAPYHLNGDLVLMILPVFLLKVLIGDSPIGFPFHLFTITLHEVGHAVTAISQGVAVNQILIGPNEGFTFTNIPNDVHKKILIGSAGYIGAAAFSGLILLLTKRPDTHRIVLGGITAAFALLLILSPLSFMNFIIILFGATLVLKAPNIGVTLALYTVTLMSCFNAMTDLFYEMQLSQHLAQAPITSDAEALQAATGTPATTWTANWITIASIILIVCALGSLVVIRPRQIAIRKKPETVDTRGWQTSMHPGYPRTPFMNAGQAMPPYPYMGQNQPYQQTYQQPYPTPGMPPYMNPNQGYGNQANAPYSNQGYGIPYNNPAQGYGVPSPTYNNPAYTQPIYPTPPVAQPIQPPVAPPVASPTGKVQPKIAPPSSDDEILLQAFFTNLQEPTDHTGKI